MLSSLLFFYVSCAIAMLFFLFFFSESQLVGLVLRDVGDFWRQPDSGCTDTKRAFSNGNVCTYFVGQFSINVFYATL